MYKNKTENVEIYFICYKKEEMELIEVYYDEVLDIHYWYFNAYLAYKHWKNNFRKIKIKGPTKNLLILAASKYLMYKLENEEYEDDEELKCIKSDLKKIEPKLQKIINTFGI